MISYNVVSASFSAWTYLLLFVLSVAISGNGLSFVSGNINDKTPAIIPAVPNTTKGSDFGVPS